jgi:hypothetical protein
VTAREELRGARVRLRAPLGPGVEFAQLGIKLTVLEPG